MVDWLCLDKFKDTLVFSQGLSIDLLQDHNIGPPKSRSLPPSALKTCRVVTWKVYLVPWEVYPVAWKVCTWCPRKLPAGLLLQTDQAQLLGHQVEFSGHHLASFQGTRWQTSGLRGPNIMSTFAPVAGQWEGLGRQVLLSKAYLPPEIIIIYIFFLLELKFIRSQFGPCVLFFWTFMRKANLLL